MTDKTGGEAAQRVHRALAVPSRRRLMSLLREADGLLGADELAAAAGLSVATVRHHLGALTEAGLVRSVATPGPGRGRPRLRYAATPAAPDPYRDLAATLAQALADGGPEAPRTAGRAWGERLLDGGGAAPGPAAERVFTYAARMGFAPEPDTDDPRRLLLRACPYRELARAGPGVVCAVHQGVLDGLLSGTGTRAELHPFVGPELCTAELRAS